MSERESHGCGACGRASLIPLGHEKWGACVPCVALAAAGTAAGWAATALCALLYPSARFVGGLALLSTFFTLPLAGHLVAYRRRRKITGGGTANTG